MTDSILQSLCDFARKMKTARIASTQLDAMKLALLDTVGCAISASSASAVESTCASLLALGGPGACSVIRHGTAAVDRATFLNGYMVRYLDCNDTYLGVRNACHPSDLIAAALAVGEAEKRSGEDVLRAILTAYHVFLDFCDAASSYDAGWDHVGIGAIAVAIEVGMLLDLSDAAMANALSLAIVPQNALLQTRKGALSQWKNLAFANAAANAVVTTYLAASGTTGPDAPFEGIYGLIAQVTGPFALRLDPGQDRSKDFFFKLFPVGDGAQGPIELALELRPRLGAFEKDDAASVLSVVDTVEIRTYEAGLTHFADSPDKWSPKTHETADHSIPFSFALALAYGRLDYDAIDRGITDPSVLKLTQKVRVVEDPEMTRRYLPEKPVYARITGERGTHEASIDGPLGSTIRPLPPERISAKFREYADPVIGAAQARALEQKLLRFETIRDVSGLLNI